MKYVKSNTEALQERHKKVYEDFFAQQEVVISSGFCYSMASGLSWRVGAPAIHHKLPFKCYVGISRGEAKGKITAGKVQYFSARLNQFREPDFDPVRWDVGIPRVEKLLNNKLGKDFDGCTVSVLMERSEDRGIDTALSQTIIAAIYLRYKLATVTEINNFARLSHKEVAQKQTPISKLYREIHTEGLKISSVIQMGSAAGSSGFSNLMYSEFPTVHVTEERAGSVRKPYGDQSYEPINVLDDVQRVEKMKWWGYRLNELSDVQGEFPLEVVSIFPGSARILYSASAYTSSVLLPSFDTLRDDIKEMFSDIDTNDNKRIPPFLKYVTQDGKYWQDYARGQVYSRLYLLRALVNLYKNKLSSATTEDFLEAIKSMFGLNAPFEETPSRNIQTIVRALRRKANQKGIPIAVRSHFWGKQDGNILVYFPPKKFRDAINEVVEDMKQEVDSSIHIDFSSWLDGWGTDGIRVEQSISDGVFSDFTNQNAKRVIQYGPKGIKTDIVERVSRSKYDILLSKIDDKIFVGGQECTSKDLPSQKATIEILSVLIEKAGIAVSNADLPKNTYTSYRNELQGKIITPLCKLVEDRLEKNLALKIEGKLMNFDVTLDLGNLKIGVLDKIS